jgi:hypothetical protein
MEQPTALTTKLTSQGLLLQISPRQTSIHKKNSKPHFHYINTRLVKELSNILKFKKLPKSLTELATLSHDFYSQKYESSVKEVMGGDELRALLELFAVTSASDVKRLPLEVTFPSHKF